MNTAAAMGPPKPSEKRTRLFRVSPRRGGVFPYLLLGPAFLLVAAFLAFPLFLLVNLSLRNVPLGRIDQVFQLPITLAEYQSVLADPATWHSLVVSLEYMVGSTGLAFALGLLTALLLNEHFPLRRLFRTLLLVPWAVPGVTATVAFLWIMTPTFGVANYMLHLVGLTQAPINWFGSASTAMVAVILPTAWKSYPFFCVILLAGLQSISKQLYEAAAADGAGRTARFRYVTWPGIRPYAALALAFNAMYMFREFDFIFASTQGGPQGVTETTAIRIYNVAFQAFDFGSAAALGVFTFALVVLVMLPFVGRFLESPS